MAVIVTGSRAAVTLPGSKIARLFVVPTPQVSASATPFSPAGDLAATNVQAAIEELDTEKLSKESGGVVAGQITMVDAALETRRTINNNFQNFRITGETGLTNDLIVLSAARLNNALAVDYYEYGVGSVLRLGGGGKVGIRNTAPAYPLDVTGDVNFSGTLRKAGKAFGAPRTHELSGFLPENISANVIRFYNGVAGYAGTNPADIVNLQKVAGYVDVDMTVTGAGGRDTGTLASFNDKSVSFYAIGHATDPTLDTVIASLSTSLSGVAYPTGFASTRAVKLGFEDIYFASGGFKSFHVDGWPLSEINRQGWTDASPWNVVNNAAGAVADTYQDLDLSGLIPYSARMVKLQFSLAYNSAAGELYFSTPGESDDKPAASINASGQKVHGSMWLRTSSLGILQWKTTTTGVRAWIRPVAWRHSEL